MQSRASALEQLLEDELRAWIVRAQSAGLPNNKISRLLLIGRLRMARVWPALHRQESAGPPVASYLEPPETSPLWDDMAFTMRMFLRATGGGRI